MARKLSNRFTIIQRQVMTSVGMTRARLFEKAMCPFCGEQAEADWFDQGDGHSTLGLSKRCTHAIDLIAGTGCRPSITFEGFKA